MSEVTETGGSPKPIHTIILDAGPLIKNVPPVSTLVAQSHALLTTPAVFAEIRDPVARNRVETLYLPFLTKRSPKPESYKIVSEFARKTGDREVLSRTDLEVLALAYEVECERNCGDWRLRSVPGQKGINGKPPAHLAGGNKEANKEGAGETPSGEEKEQAAEPSVETVSEELEAATLKDNPASTEEGKESAQPAQPSPVGSEQDGSDDNSEDDEKSAESDSDTDGWITPSNIKKRQIRDSGEATSTPEQKVMQAATITTDFAMQNVLLQMNLNILSTSTLQQIRHLKSYILRCHACFFTTREMSKQFCPRCGHGTLNRVSCSTSSSGVFKLHLKKNMQWNSRGNIFSVPKPTTGSASGKWNGAGGGKGGWGDSLILAEDQKQYVRAVTEEERRARKGRDLMDEDYLPSILSGDRNRTGGRIKVGAGRNVNSKKRR